MIVSERFILRKLIEKDATSDYLTWLIDDSEIGRYILGSSSRVNIDSMREYIKDKNNREDVFFLESLKKNL